ncbi:thioredoxin [bacterium (Candidatus Gribaldobacteria) CG23_combo_of_CG06-09_8_20_14_all_37_87_8]|uniref:Thioredoxin n=1 Tax=bacterium (Candidatus Gribaldobacteria) CG23_combo_of_CG06-09_8_20_14_all_37_87_8 TaxID=2014278 RepID=A0A2G9ZFZ0_9BACT|nr:MAG: thioredoxin [bacterium (Candidatus Gribaldobacteria) CG23_combo_of_CG06-09_8_20_14_all_37_87_8]
MTLILTDKNFKKEIQNTEKPILVDFWSAHCFPCFMLSPILEKIAEEYKDKMIFAKLNIDESPVIAREYQIDRIPVVLLFKEGKPVAGFIGVQSEELIREWLEKNLK